MSPSENCIFCKIASKAIKAEIVLENNSIVVFRDISPKAPKHLLAIPREHVTEIGQLAGLEATLFAAIERVVADEGLEEGGYRIVMNRGRDAGQEVPHLHFHILGGRRLGWPPG